MLKDPLFEHIVCHGAHQNMRDLNNNFKCHKVNNTMLNIVLVSQHINIDDFSEDVYPEGSIGHHKCYPGTSEVLRMVVYKLH